MAEKFLEDHGVVWQAISIDERALLICQTLWLEMLNLAPETDRDGKLDLEQFQMELGVSGWSCLIRVEVNNKCG